MALRSLMKMAVGAFPPIRRVLDERNAAIARANSATAALQNQWSKDTALKRALASFDINHEALADLDADAWTTFGQQFLEEGRAAEATRAYEKALALEPGRRDAAFGLGRALYSDSRREEAMKHFRDLIARDPHNLRYYFFYLGASLQLNGHRNAAVAAWTVEMETQAHLAEKAGVAQSTRYLPATCTRSLAHMALLDSWAKRQLLGLSPAEHYVIYAPPADGANDAYLDRWKRYFSVVTGPESELSHLLDDNINLMSLNGRWLWLHDAACEVEKQWEASGHGPLLQLGKEEIACGKAAMAAMGLPAGAWFVTVHVDDVGCASDDEMLCSHVEVDVSDYMLAVRTVTDAGGWVVRLGNPASPRLPAMPRVIDYVKQEGTDWLDLYLLAAARFVIGTNSGPSWVAGTFGVPALLTNSTPLGVQSHFGNSITLPQLLRSDTEGRQLTFAEQMAEPFAWVGSSTMLTDLRCTPIKNTPEEIAAGVAEMVGRLRQTWSESADDADRQQRFGAALVRAGISSRSRIGSQFLKAHAELLGDPSP